MAFNNIYSIIYGNFFPKYILFNIYVLAEDEKLENS
jgi:hypothetical protein